jgi:NADH:ubiquinone reductase (H+-translocating)
MVGEKANPHRIGSLYEMHEHALHGPTKVTLNTAARLITRRTEPQKLH